MKTIISTSIQLVLVANGLMTSRQSFSSTIQNLNNCPLTSRSIQAKTQQDNCPFYDKNTLLQTNKIYPIGPMTITQYPSSTNNQYSSKRHQRAQRHPKQANNISKSCKVLTPNQSHPKHQQLKTNHKPLLIPLHSTPQQANHRTRRMKKKITLRSITNHRHQGPP